MKKIIELLSGLTMLAICTMGFISVQAVHTFEKQRSDEEYAEELKRYEGDYVLGDNGIFYSKKQGGDFEFDPYEPNPGTFDRSPLLMMLLNQYPDSKFFVHIHCYGYDAFDSDEESSRLRQNGISVMKYGSERVAVLDAEQLENFPAVETVGYLIGLAEPYQGLYQLGDDDIFYNMDNGEDILTIVPEPGTVYHGSMLSGLVQRYPEGRFAVYLNCYGDSAEYDYYEEMERLRQNGIEVTENGHLWFTILDAEQIENFPAGETAGYWMTFASKPDEAVPSETVTDNVSLYGDVNCDGEVNIIDVVVLNQNLMLGVFISEQGVYNADVDRNGSLNATDSLNIMKYVVGIIKSFEAQ